LGETLTFEVQKGKFVQVLNVYGSHWITISNILCSSGVVAVYDSKPDCTLSNQTKRQIASILMTDEEVIYIQIVQVQAQMGTSDCGLFSLAFATSLCAGINPAEKCYIQSDFRVHLFKCLENRKITPFPAKTRKNKAVARHYITVEVHCVCRQPEYGAMISCDSCTKWFHKNCVKAPKAAWNKRGCT